MKNNKPKEERHERFQRLAEKRTERVLESLRVLGNCSNKSAYHYTDEEINKIFRVIDEQLRTTKARFRGHKNNKKRFKL